MNLPAAFERGIARAKKAHIFERDPLEWYQEPEAVTAALLTVESFVGPIWDPCCGGGNIVRVLRAAGLDGQGSDVVRRVPADCPWFIGERDFLKSGLIATNIVMNPPYFRARGTEAFIRHALAHAQAKVACFADARFLYGAKRAEGLFLDLPPTRIWHITPRPSCPPGAWLAEGNVAGGGTADYCWLVWDLTVPHAGTVTGWLKRQVAG